MNTQVFASICFIIICVVIVVGMVFYLKASWDEHINLHEKDTLSTILPPNLLLSNMEINGVNRQDIVLSYKPIYGVKNMGDTMDHKEIYTPEYDKMGL